MIIRWFARACAACSQRRRTWRLSAKPLPGRRRWLRRRFCQPEVLLLDIRMPDGTGLTVLDQIKAVSPVTHVIMVTMHDSPEYISRAIAAGAAGYVLKEVSRQDLLSAIRTVVKPSAAATPFLSSTSRRAAFTSPPASAHRQVPPLSVRSNANCCSCWPMASTTGRSVSTCAAAWEPSRITSSTSSPPFRSRTEPAQSWKPSGSV